MVNTYLLVVSRGMKAQHLEEFQDMLNDHAERNGYELCDLVFASEGDPRSPPRLIAVMRLARENE